jgi:(4-(4-[2-(gamma-L-glutamylamino)ethyl]phenoxymethyl)furan-2-yl)methanamine synthase
MTPAVLGWDIGGVNTKVARIDQNQASAPEVVSIAYQLQYDLSALPSVLRSAADQLGATPHDQHGITMTAELSQAFRTKREGVGFVLDALESVFPSDSLHVYTVRGEFVRPETARSRSLEVAASNWSAMARWVARTTSTCILIDVGSTTTDLIPIVDGEVRAEGNTDPDRLLTGELVYTGAVRTPVEAVTTRVPLRNGSAGVSAEGFAVMGDVHVWLGRLSPQDYTSPTPDGRPITREYAGERLARVVCGDREMLDEQAITGIAVALARAQRDLIVGALRRLKRRHPTVETAVLAGLGEFIGREAAECAGFRVAPLADQIGAAAITAPAFAVASLLRDSLMLKS